jgi:acetylornithine deacetylase/succinyl-diaminopimelate desuccinylase-like protein
VYAPGIYNPRTMNKLPLVLGCVIILSSWSSAQQTALTPEHQLAREILKELIEINTTDTPAGNVTTAAEAMAARFRAAGFAAEDINVIGPLPNKKNLVVRLHGRGQEHGQDQRQAKPILFLAHLDVVEALRQDWSMNLDPFKLNEVDGFFYGRGTSDIKDGDTLLVENFLRLKKEGWMPSRDLILALTADEEGGQSNGVQWLAANHRELIDAEYCINTDAGNFEAKKGKRLLLGLQTSEKNYVDFRLEVKSNGGHSSRPVRGDNAIYHLAQGLSRLAAFDFPVSLNETTRGFFERTAALEIPATAKDFRAVIGSDPAPAKAAARRLSVSPYYNALLRTTCVATRLEGGHANNALPQTAAAIVNCRMLPQDSLQNVQNTLKRVLADDRISLSVVGEAVPAPASAINPAIVRTLDALSARLYGGLPIVPVMDNGASDGKYLRIAGIPAYGVPGVFTDVDDDRAHGKDERIGVKDFYDGVDFYYEFIKALGR